MTITGFLNIDAKIAYFMPKKIWDAKNEILCVTRMQKIDKRYIPLAR